MRLFTFNATYCHVLTTIMLGMFFLFGCSNESEHKAQVVHAEHSDVSDAQLLSLNAGNLWQLDSHTRDMLQIMIKRFDQLDAKNATNEQLTELGKSLKGDLDTLISGCTMVGDAHNALHKYLIMYIPAVDNLRNSGGLEEAKKVHGLLNVYPEYFE